MESGNDQTGASEHQHTADGSVSAQEMSEKVQEQQEQGDEDEEEEVLFDAQETEADLVAEEDRRKQLKQQFVNELVGNVMPFVEACDRQAYGVAASQEALLGRIKYLQGMLSKFTDAETELVPDLASSATKLNDAKHKIQNVNSRLSAIQYRLATVTKRLQQQQQ